MTSAGYVITISGDHNDSNLLLGSQSGSIKEENLYSGSGPSNVNLDAVNNKIALVESSITTITSNIQTNVSKLQSIEGLLGQELGVDTSEISLLTSGITENKTNIASNKTTISGNVSAIASNKDLITENTNVITTNRSKITALESEISTISDSLSINNNNIKVLKLSLESLEGNINSATSSYSKYSSNNTIVPKTVAPGNTSDSIVELLAQINALADKLSALESTVSTVESSVQQFIKPRVELNPETFFLQVYSHYDETGPLHIYNTAVLDDTSVNPIPNPVNPLAPFRNDLIASATEIKDISYVNSVSDICFGVFGNYTQTVTVTDIFDNVTVVERPIIVGDFVGPDIKDSSSGVVFSGFGAGKATKIDSLANQLLVVKKPISLQDKFNEKSVSGEDLYDFNKTNTFTPVTLVNDFSFTKEGLYDVKYSSTDTCGNTTNATRNVYIYGAVGHTSLVGTLNSFDTSLKTAKITKSSLSVTPTVGTKLEIAGLKYEVVSVDNSLNIVGVPGSKDNLQTIFDLTLDVGIIASTISVNQTVNVFNDDYLNPDTFSDLYVKANPAFTFFEASGGYVYIDNSVNDVIISDVSGGSGIEYYNIANKSVLATDISITDLIKTATDVSSLDYWVSQALYSGDNSGLVFDVTSFLVNNYAIPIGAYDGSVRYNTTILPILNAIGLLANVPDLSSATQALDLIESTFNASSAGSGTIFVSTISGDVTEAAIENGFTPQTAGSKSLVVAVLNVTLNVLKNNFGVTDLSESTIQTFTQDLYTQIVSSGILTYKYLVESKYDPDVSAVLTRYIALGDFTKPVLTDTGKSLNVYNYNDVSNLTLGDLSAVMFDVTAFDKAHGDITSSIVRTVNGNKFLNVSDISLNNYGAEYSIVYDVSDSYNNNADPLTKVVVIKDTEGPVIQLYSVTYVNGLPIAKVSNTPSNPQLLDPSLNTYIDPIRFYSTLYGSSSATAFGTALGITGDEFSARAAQGEYSDDRYNDITELTLTISGEQNVKTNVPGSYVVDIRITDPAGNFTDVSRNITVKPDTEGPIITLVDPELKKYYDVFSYNYVEQGASALDVVEGEKPVTIKYYKGDISINPYASEITIDMMTNSYTGKGKQGLYSVKYDSIDNLDNSSSVVRQIYIFADESSPSISVDPSIIYIQPGEFTSVGTYNSLLTGAQRAVSQEFINSKYYDFTSGLHNFVSVFDSQNPVLLLDISTTFNIPSGVPGAGTQDLCFNFFMDASHDDITEIIQVTDTDGNSGFVERKIRITDNAPPVITISGDPYPEPISINIVDASNLSLLTAINNDYPISATDTGAALRGQSVEVVLVNDLTILPAYAQNGPWSRNVVFQSTDPCNNLTSTLERRVIIEPEIITVPADYDILGRVMGYSFNGSQIQVKQDATSGNDKTSSSHRPIKSTFYVNGVRLNFDGSGNVPFVSEQYGNQVYNLSTAVSNTNEILTTGYPLYADISTNY